MDVPILATLLLSHQPSLFQLHTTFFVTSNSTYFALTISQPNSVFSFAPAVYNPYGFGSPSYIFAIASGSTVKFAANPSYSFNNVIVNPFGVTGGTVRFTGGTSNTISVAGTLLVNSGATAWVDLVTLNAFNLTVASAPTSSSAPGYYKYSIASGSQSSLVTAMYSIYGGGAIIYLSNYNPTSPTSAITIISSQVATGNVLAPVGGSAGYSYSLSRSGASLAVTITPNPTPIPFPTQSNGPAPPVNFATSSSHFSLVILSISLCFALFALF